MGSSHWHSRTDTLAGRQERKEESGYLSIYNSTEKAELASTIRKD